MEIMSGNGLKHFLITGDPGIGKTTLTKKVSIILRDKGVNTSGFYTEEVRNNKVREGFDVVSLNGSRGRLARDQSLLHHPVKYKVGKYGVLVQEFENIALPSLESSEKTEVSHAHLLVIDEIGKMELFSEQFKNKIKEIFNPLSDNVVLATIPVRKGDPLIESIKNDKRSKVWVVTRANRDSIQEEILHAIKNVIKF